MDCDKPTGEPQSQASTTKESDDKELLSASDSVQINQSIESLTESAIGHSVLSLETLGESSTTPNARHSEETSSMISYEAQSSLSNPSSSKPSKSTEMQFYLDKLKDMIPYTKNSPRMSKVQLIHSAIDYITDLQESLEARVKRKRNTTVEESSNRKPLADLSITKQHSNSNKGSDDESNKSLPPYTTPQELFLISQEIASGSSTTHFTVSESEGSTAASSSTIIQEEKNIEVSDIQKVLKNSTTGYFSTAANIQEKEKFARPIEEVVSTTEPELDVEALLHRSKKRKLDDVINEKGS